MADGRIIIDTQIDNSGAEKGIGKLNSIANKGLKAATVAITGATTALGGMSAYAIKVGGDFEEGMSKVSAISGATGNDLEALANKAKEMGAKTKFSATESAEALQYMAMAGWKTQDMLNGLPGIMNLAAASGEELASVSDIVTDALTAFGLQAKDSAHFADVLAKASSNSNTNVGMMGATFKYVAPIAGSLKYSIEDTAVAIGLMANAGIKGEQAGTALRSMLTRLVKPPREAAIALKSLGVSAINANGTMKPLNQVLSDLRTAFSKLDDSQKASYASSIAGTEAMSGMLAIVNASQSDFDKLTEAIANSNGAAEEMANTMNDNLKGKITILKSGLEGLGISAYEKFQGPMKDAVDTVIKSVEELSNSMNGGELEVSISNLADVFADLISNLATFLVDHLPGIINGLTWLLDNSSAIASGIAGIGTAMMTMKVANMIMGLVEAFKAFKLANEGATIAQWLLNAAMNANPVILIVSLIAGLIAAIIVLWNTNEDFRNFWINAWESIKQGVINAWNSVSKFFTETIPETFDNMIQSIIDWKNNVIHYFKDMYNNTKQAILDWVNGVKESFVQWKNDTIATIKGWGQSISDFFTETIPEWINSIAEWFGQLPYRIGYKLGEAAARIYLWGQEVWTFFTETIPNWIESIGQWFSELPGKIWSWLVETYNRFIQWKEETKEVIRQWATDMITSFSDWISETYNKVSTWASDMRNKAVEMASNFINSIIEWFRQLPTRISNWLTETINKVVQWKNDLVQTARRAAQDFFNSIIQKAKEIPGQMLNVGRDIVRGVWNGIVGAKDWFMGKVGDFFSGIVDGAKSVLGIHSPSRVFRDQVGKYMAQGVSVGFEKETSNVQNSIEDNLFDLTAKMKATVNYEVSRNNARVIDKNSYLSTDNNSVDLRGIINAINKIASRPIDNRIVIDGREVAMATAPYQDEWERWNEGR